MPAVVGGFAERNETGHGAQIRIGHGDDLAVQILLLGIQTGQTDSDQLHLGVDQMLADGDGCWLSLGRTQVQPLVLGRLHVVVGQAFGLGLVAIQCGIQLLTQAFNASIVAVLDAHLVEATTQGLLLCFVGVDRLIRGCGQRVGVLLFAHDSVSMKGVQKKGGESVLPTFGSD
ncbi:MAG: hypothetical protein [Podoviridae sp. ctda_1]|nr:MAG: hypothetical protein [Podoviridae sp. ctda_1]